MDNFDLFCFHNTSSFRSAERKEIQSAYLSVNFIAFYQFTSVQ